MEKSASSTKATKGELLNSTEATGLGTEQE